MNKKQRFFELRDEMKIKGRWHLRGPVDRQGNPVQSWQFNEGRALVIDYILFPVNPVGVELEFTISTLGIPVLHGRVTSLLQELNLLQNVQLIPAHIEGHKAPYFILNPLSIVRCVDDARCEEVQYWGPEDGEPTRVGQYRDIVGLKIDHSKVGDVNIFRPWGWQVALIVSERVKQTMEDEDVIGPRFIEV